MGLLVMLALLPEGEFTNFQKVYISETDLPSKENFMKTLVFWFFFGNSVKKDLRVNSSHEPPGRKSLYICIPFEEIADDQRSV